VRTALSQLALVLRSYIAPAHREQALIDSADALWVLARAARAGSDTQFQLVKAFATLASTPEHIATLHSLRDFSVSLDGLAIDQDLDWELLAGLAVAGGISAPDIDATLALDNTSNGAQAAARARSLLPGAKDKKAVFDQLVKSNDTPNAIVRSLTLGFDVANNPTVLESLVGEYFNMLETIWDERTYKIAEYLVEGLYPGSLVSESLVAATKKWLAEHPDTPALRRMVIENLAGVERALRVQALDAKS
jgi:aminopeptidase N